MKSGLIHLRLRLAIFAAILDPKSGASEGERREARKHYERLTAKKDAAAHEPGRSQTEFGNEEEDSPMSNPHSGRPGRAA